MVPENETYKREAILLVAAGSGAWISAFLTCIWPPDRDPFSNPIPPLLDNAKKKIWKSLD